jgi:hypothetical protein
MTPRTHPLTASRRSFTPALVELLNSRVRFSSRGEVEFAGNGESTREAHRHTIRQICLAWRHEFHGPENFLVAFKEALNYAANEVGLPLGPVRSELSARLVGVFIEELYACADLVAEDGACRGKSRKRITPAAEGQIVRNFR